MDLTYCKSSCLERFTGIYLIIVADSFLFLLSISSQVNYEFDGFVMKIWVQFRKRVRHLWVDSSLPIFDQLQYYRKKKKKLLEETKKKSQPLKNDEICGTRSRYSQ